MSSGMARQTFQGVAVRAVAPFSFGCEENVKLTRKMGKHIVIGLEITQGCRLPGGRKVFHALLDFLQTRMRMARIYQPIHDPYPARQSGGIGYCQVDSD